MTAIQRIFLKRLCLLTLLIFICYNAIWLPVLARFSLSLKSGQQLIKGSSKFGSYGRDTDLLGKERRN